MHTTHGSLLQTHRFGRVASAAGWLLVAATVAGLLWMAVAPPGTSTTVVPAAETALAPPAPVRAKRAVAVEEGGEPSPTGRRPRLLWTGRRQAVWNRMRRNDHPLWRALKANADMDRPRYGAFGPWAVLVYQMTGDEAYARKAWKQIEPFLAPGWKPADGRNYTRQDLITLAWMYDWLYPSLSPDQRSKFIAKMNYFADLTLNRVPGTPWGTRLRDSDETVGHYFGLALIDLATTPDNPRAGSFLEATFKAEEASVFVGGLEPTGAGVQSGMRNAIREYASMARGGQWIESTEYNLNTLKLLLLGAEGVRTATGQDYFPEISDLTREAALAQIYELTPDLNSSLQWGDTEKPRDLDLFHRVPLLGMLAGLTRPDPKLGPYMQSLTKQLTAKAMEKGSPPSWYFYLFYDPYAPAADWRGELPKGHYALGQGLMFFQDGWKPDSSMFAAHMLPLVPFVDHQAAYFGDFQLYRKGEWAVTHPLDYHGPAHRGEASNGMLFAGLGMMREWRGPVAQEFGAKGEYAYLAGANGGQFYDQPYFSPPETFVHEWTRSLFYLPAPDGRSDTIVTYDRTHVDDPRPQPRIKRYRPEQLKPVESAPALKQWLVHATTRPAVGAASVLWPTPKGEQVRLTTLLPTEVRKEVIDLDELWPDKWPYAIKSEQKWQVRVMPVKEQSWQTFLNVVQASSPNTPLSSALVRSAAGEAEGVLLERAGNPDTLLLFNARPGAKLPQPAGTKLDPRVGRILREAHLARAGYTVTWRSSTNATDAYLLDLDPSKKWSAQLDGAPAALDVSDQGVGKLRILNPGAHTLVLKATS
ncbi:MAG: hypothetical protein ACO1SX_12865 [Actinomycetota bacterium]